MNPEIGNRKSEVGTPAIFQIGETVWSAIAPGECGMVTGIIHRPGYVRYGVTWAKDHTTESDHFEIELSREPCYQQPTR